jgi:Asp/Glu/hydantoin racemase
MSRSDRPRISLIHATPLAVAPIEESFLRLWPSARLCNLLDDSLTADLKSHGGDVDAMNPRIAALAAYAAESGAQAILFTCSAFGSAIAAARRRMDIPVLTPNEAMIDDALDLGPRVALVATFEPAIASIRAEFEAVAKARSMDLDLRPIFVANAWTALQAGNVATHDRLVMEACRTLGERDAICFAQFSMTTAAAISTAASCAPVLTTPDGAVRRLMRLLDIEH